MTAANSRDWLDSLAQYDDKFDCGVSHTTGVRVELLVFFDYGALELSAIDGVVIANDLERLIRAVSDQMGDVQVVYQRLAQEYKTCISGAPAPVIDGSSRLVNRAALYAPDGNFDHQAKFFIIRF